MRPWLSSLGTTLKTEVDSLPQLFRAGGASERRSPSSSLVAAKPCAANTAKPASRIACALAYKVAMRRGEQQRRAALRSGKKNFLARSNSTKFQCGQSGAVLELTPQIVAEAISISSISAFETANQPTAESGQYGDAVRSTFVSTCSGNTFNGRYVKEYANSTALHLELEELKRTGK
jgi:hypothetical protein